MTTRIIHIISEFGGLIFLLLYVGVPQGSALGPTLFIGIITDYFLAPPSYRLYLKYSFKVKCNTPENVKWIKIGFD